MCCAVSEEYRRERESVGKAGNERDGLWREPEKGDRRDLGLRVREEARLRDREAAKQENKRETDREKERMKQGKRQSCPALHHSKQE